MKENVHTVQELFQWQALPLSIKIAMTKSRIRDWVNAFGENGVYVSFSGGKDSTVLLHIAREMYPKIKAVFIDTGLEYPEIRKFAKSVDNIDILKPKMSFKKICEKYGFPLISKEVAENIYGSKKYLMQIIEENQNFKQLVDAENSTNSLESSVEFAELLNERMTKRIGGNNQRLAIMLGMLTKDKSHPIKANVTGKERSKFSHGRYKFLLYSKFSISNRCCNVMKKEPAHRYSKETGRMPITAQMASESRIRKQKWLENGCNVYDAKFPVSNPMSFWTEQDVLLYIKTKNVPIASVYGKVVLDNNGNDLLEGQMSIMDYMPESEKKEYESDAPLLKTTGEKRTGCVLCGFGCHLEKGEGRFERLAKTHPKYMKVFDVIKNNGVTYREAIEWINEYNGKGEIIKLPETSNGGEE